MAIQVNYTPDIGAMGQIAYQGGQFQGQQQALQNQLALGRLSLQRQQLAQQGQQFNDQLRFNALSMDYQTRARQQSQLQEQGFRARQQAAGIQGNLVSQAMATQARSQLQQEQFDFAAQQDQFQAQQRLNLLAEQDRIRNETRDAEFKERQKMMQFEDEMTRERYEWQLTHRQKAEQRQIQNHIDAIRLNGDFEESEKEDAIRQLQAKMMGIQPSPQALRQEFPDNKGIGELWDESGHVLTRRPDGQVEVLFERPDTPQIQIDPYDGASFILKGDKVVTIGHSPFDGPSEAKVFSDFMKSLWDIEKEVPGTDETGPTFRKLTPQERQEEVMQFIELRNQMREQYVKSRMAAMQQKTQSDIQARQPQQQQPSLLDQALGLGGQVAGGIANRQARIDQFVANVAAQRGTIPGELAAELQLAKPLSADQYSKLPPQAYYYNVATGQVLQKGNDGGFSLETKDSIGSNMGSTIGVYESMRNNPMRFNRFRTDARYQRVRE